MKIASRIIVKIIGDTIKVYFEDLDNYPMIYTIEQDDNGRFYIIGNNGYNGYEADGIKDLEKAIKEAKAKITMEIREIQLYKEMSHE